METLILVEIMHLKCQCDLENKAKVIKKLSTLFLLPTMYLCKFGQNPMRSTPNRGGGHKHKFAYICKFEVCSHTIFTNKFAHGV